MTAPKPRHNKQPVMRSLGQFVGHIVKGVKSEPDAQQRQEVHREVQEEHRDTPDGRITLRRTVVEEVEFERHPDT